MKTKEQFSVEKIKPGDLVDFGNYGELYVTNIFQNCYWVTNLNVDRYENSPAGWSISKSFAIKIIEKGNNHENIRIL